MGNDDLETRAFLFELYTQTNGDLDAQVSMYDIGNTVGLEQEDVEQIAQSMYIQGLAEMKTLSGGIGITLAGLKFLDIEVAAKGGDLYQLPLKKILEDSDRMQIDSIVQRIKDASVNQAQDYSQIETLVIDIKCIEMQMLSPHPKTEVIRQLLVSCKDHFDFNGSSDLVNRLDVMTAN